MAKVTICDVCITRHNKLTRAVNRMHVKGRKDLSIVLCHVHSFEIESKFPRVTVEYVQFVYKMARRKELSPEGAQDVLRKGR